MVHDSERLVLALRSRVQDGPVQLGPIRRWNGRPVKLPLTPQENCNPEPASSPELFKERCTRT